MWADVRDDEGGAALVMAMLGVLIIAGLVTVMMARTLTETRLTSSARDRETAIHIAESGIDDVIVGLNLDEEYVTIAPSSGAPHEFSPALNADLADQRAWALSVAQDPAQCDVIPTSGGETCGIRPVKAGAELPWVFGVGFVPNRAEANKVRVVKIQFDQGFFSPAKAILTNGNLTFGSRVCGAAANVHSNGQMTINGTADNTSCAEPDGTVTTTGTCSGNSPNTTCQEVDRTERIPEIRAETAYERQALNEANKDNPSTPAYEGKWFDLCRDGTIRSPNIDATTGELVTSGGRVQPCTGPILSTNGETYVGWRLRGTTWETTPRVIPDGVYYLHHTNGDVNGNLVGASGVINMTVLADAEGDIVGQPDTGDCDTRNGSASGNINLTGVGGGAMNPYLQDLMFLTDGDFTTSGNSSTTIHGVIVSHEQVKLGGNVTYTGAVISEGACSSPGSPVPLNGSSTEGNFTLTHNGDLSLPLDSVTRITAWNEL